MDFSWKLSTLYKKNDLSSRIHRSIYMEVYVGWIPALHLSIHGWILMKENCWICKTMRALLVTTLLHGIEKFKEYSSKVRLLVTAPLLQHRGIVYSISTQAIYWYAIKVKPNSARKEEEGNKKGINSNLELPGPTLLATQASFFFFFGKKTRLL